MNKFKTFFTECIFSQLLLGVALFPGTGDMDMTVHFITVKGTAICSSDQFFIFKNVRVDLYDEDQLKTSAEVDEFGRFSQRYEAKKGKHTAILVLKSNSKLIDKAGFGSDKIHEEISVNLKACPNPSK